jgi:hypothetical protein
LTQEDPITRIVKEKLSEKSSQPIKSGLKIQTESFEKQVDDILGDIFKDSSL